MAQPGVTRLLRPLRPRDPLEEHRAATPLELFTDLCFVVAVSQAASSLHHAISHGQVGDGATHFAMAFFGLFWAWLNFTWFGSAYDNDDLVYRLLTILQIIGSLVYAAGIPRVAEGDFRLGVAGYVIMRITLVTQWVRVLRNDPARRTTAFRYATGVTLVQVGWVCYLLLPAHLGVAGFAVLALCEVVVPAWAERPAVTPWHPHHIAERYSLFFIIVLGETILSSTLAIQAALDAGQAGHLVVLIVGGVPLVFSLWWLYFSREDADLLLDRSLSANMVWGFGHYFVFSSAAAVGAGLAARVDHYTQHSESSDHLTAAAVTVPTAVLVASVYAFHLSQHDRTVRTAAGFAACVVVVLAGTFTPAPELVAGLACTALLALVVVRPQPGAEDAGPGTTATTASR